MESDPPRRDIDSELPSAWPPPWHALLAGALLILSINAFAQREWLLALTMLLLALVAGASRHHARPN